MAGPALYDILLQYRHAVVHDIQLRVLNASVSGTSRVKTPWSRRIEQPMAPLEVKAHWNKPQVTVEDGQIELSAEISGGARQVVTGRILTLEGEVSAKHNLTPAVDTHGRPYGRVPSPDPQSLNMRKLKATYEGSRWPPFLAKLNPAKEGTNLRPVITTQLFGQLARIPLTYMPTSFPIAVPTRKRMAAKTLPIVQTLPGTLDKSGSVVLALMLDRTHVPPSTFVNLLPDNFPYNAAISISTQGLNTLIMHLLRHGQAMGQFQHSRFGQTHWQWETLTVTLLNRTIRIEGVLLQQGVRTVVQAEIQCWLDDNNSVQCRLLSHSTDPLVAETLVASWIELLKTLLCTPAARQRNKGTHSGEQLTQIFEIPTTPQTVEAVAQELVVMNGRLIAYYTIPTSPKTLPLELAPPKPSVTIVQPRIPHQAYQGAAVTTRVEARITRGSLRPYDYAWNTGLSPEPLLEHGSKPTIHITPSPVPKSGLQRLTTVHLKLIDMFGQVTETQAPIQYIASTQSKAKGTAHHTRRNLVILAGGVLALLAGSGAFVALTKVFGDPPPDPPCSPDQLKCKGTCVQNDSPNCGSCGNVCGSGTTCVNGKCACPSGLVSCNGTCVNLKDDSHNCGGCNHTCPSDKVCSNGQCQGHCSSGQTNCSGSCVNLNSDSKNCGTCGNVCPSSQTCVNGICQQQPCPSGQTRCNGNCTNLNSDSNNCGSCSHTCPSNTVCSNGQCQDHCSSGQTNCSGSCANLNSDSSNCGNCGNVCPSGQICVNGTCCTACNGACVNFNIDNNNCGNCGNVCPSGQTCVNGTCCTACNGACVNFNTDNNNCGNCGNVCPSGQTCVNGTCQCPSGQTNCSGVCKNLNSDASNCGYCGNVCPSGGSCANGTCQCPSGQTNCSGSCVNLNSDSNNCGYCGNVCPSGYICSNGVCCSSGLTYCYGSCVNTNNDPAHCGSCDHDCPSVDSCCSGICVNTNNDTGNCGNCGNPCGSGIICCKGVCCAPNSTCCNGSCCPSYCFCLNGICQCIQ